MAAATKCLNSRDMTIPSQWRSGCPGRSCKKNSPGTGPRCLLISGHDEGLAAKQWRSDISLRRSLDLMPCRHPAGRARQAIDLPEKPPGGVSSAVSIAERLDDGDGGTSARYLTPVSQGLSVPLSTDMPLPALKADGSIGKHQTATPGLQFRHGAATVQTLVAAGIKKVQTGRGSIRVRRCEWAARRL